MGSAGDVERSSELAAAVDACRAALADYEAGLLSDDELRQELFRAGVVHRDGEVWLLDLERGTWQRYDGVSLTEPFFQVRPTQVTRWRDALDRIRDDAADRAGPAPSDRGR